MRSPVQVAIPVIAPRALVVWGLTRLMVATLPLAIGAPFGSISPPSVVVVLLAGLVGIVDIRVRGERMLWANLGVTPRALYALYAAAGIPAEWLLVLALR